VTRRYWSPLVIVASSGAAMLGGVVSSGTSSVRTLLIAWFLVVAPGLALIGLLRLRDVWLELALVPALSLAVDAIVAGTLSYTGLWSPAAAIMILVAICVGGALAQDAAAAKLGLRDGAP